MSKKEITKKEITLYYADWCSHCHHFLPEWYRLKNIYNKFKKQIAETYGIELIINEYMEGTKEMETRLKEKSNIKINGYPTIHIEYGEVTEYEGKRSALNLFQTVVTQLINPRDKLSEDIKKECENNNENITIMGRISLLEEGNKNGRNKGSSTNNLMKEIMNIKTSKIDKYDNNLQRAGFSKNDSLYYYKYIKYLRKCQNANIGVPKN